MRNGAGRSILTRSYLIIIDDSEVGSVSNGETASVEVAAGHHAVRLKIDWTGSRTLAFEAQDGEVKEFDCEPRYPGAMALIALLESVARHDRWIRLTPRQLLPVPQPSRIWIGLRDGLALK